MAVALGAGGALALLVVTVPGALASITGEEPAAARSAGPPPASEVVLPAVVVAGNSCVADGHDLVAVSLDGGSHEVPLDGCGSVVGSVTTVRVLAADDATGRRVPRGEARVLGTGGTAPLTDPAADAPSPMAGRITVTLTVAAGIAMAGLLVALFRDGRGREGARPRTATPAGPAAPRGGSAAGPGTTGSRSADGRATTDRREGTTGADRRDGPRRSGESGPGPTRSRARSLRAPHPVRTARREGRLGPGPERRGPTPRARTRRPR